MIRQFVNKFVTAIVKPLKSNNVSVTYRNWYGSDAESKTSEREITEILQKRFPNAKSITVEDVSGGCGAMYDIFVESTDFKGLPIVKQHQSITNTLKEQIKLIHGLRISTKVPA